MIDRWMVDSPPSERYPIYTRANVGEVFPEPVAPLTATIGINEGAEPGWRDAFERFGAFSRDEFDPDNNVIIGVFGGYCYLNVTVSRILGVRTPGLTPEMIDYTFFGEQPGIPPYQAQPTDDNEALTARIGETLQWVLTAEDLPELAEEQAMLADLRKERPDLTTLTEVELVGRLRDLWGRHFRRLFAQHLFITYASTVPTGIIQQVVTEMGEPGHLLRLIAGVGDVESAAPSFALWDLGRIAAASPSLTAAFDEGVDGLDFRLRTLAASDAAVGEFVAAFDSFLFDHGSRGPNEWEMRSPTWETDPDLALAAVDRMRLMSEAESPANHQAQRAADRTALGPQLVDALDGNPEVQQQFAAALRAATVFLAGRERSKTNAIKLIHECRVAMNELGHRFVAAGHFDRANNYGMVTNTELDLLLADPAAWTDEIRRREGLYAELVEVEPPFVFEGEPPALATWARRADRRVASAAAGDVLTGIPGCCGKATARARVVLDPHHAHSLQPGDVLVAPITDPSWTPLFVPASAVVVDVGAPFSHAIIVSRELGIPCVVSVTDATKRIPDGALVTVDGDAGTVTIEEVSTVLDRWIVDNEPSASYPIYTRANAGEVYPDPVSPLSGSLVFMQAGEAGWRDAYLRYSMRPDEFDLSRAEILGCFGGYLYLNMSLTRLFGVRMPGMTPEMVDFQYFGEMPGIPPYVPKLGDEDEERTAALQGWVNELFTREHVAELLDRRTEVDALVAARPDLASLSDRDLVAQLRSFVPHYRPLFDEHITVSAASGIGTGTVAGICDAVGEPALTMTLVAGIGDVDSAAPSYTMWDLSRLDADSDEFRDGFAAFLVAFGSHGPNEWELRSPTWGTRPEIALAAIDHIRAVPDHAAPLANQAAREAEADREAERVAAMLQDDPDTLAQFRAGLRSARLYLAGRERTKTTIIKIVHEMRLAALELGRRHAAAGHVDDAGLVFMLKADELDEFVTYPAAFGALLREREQCYLELFELDPPFIVVGEAPPLGKWLRRADRTASVAAVGTVLTGIPGCPGVAKGRARVVLDPADPVGLEPGDVLVAPITDPAWTPLFVPAGAVVVDVGAQVSHAVIVSRELGIPCVVSVTGATRTIPDGAIVEVDGTAGTVTVV